MDTNNETTKPQGTFYDGLTGEMVIRELTDKEISSIYYPDDKPFYLPSIEKP